MMTGLNTKPYCTCIETGTWLRQDGYTLDGRSGLWVHPRCMKPSLMNYNRMVLKLPQIPQTSVVDDIYYQERRYIAMKEIMLELGWVDHPNDEDWEGFIDD